MEAARVSALKGHTVTLWEKEDALGGNLIPASVPDFKDDYRLLIGYLSTQLHKLGVAVELQKEATPESVATVHPDVLFVAAGARPIIPDIEGIHKGMEARRVVTAVDALLGKAEIGQSLAVIGGGLVGCETALHFAQKGKDVTVVEMLDTVAGDMVWGNALDLIKLLDDNGVEILTGVRVVRVTETGIDLASETSEKKSLRADTTVIAVGMESNRGLLESLLDGVDEVYAIGDCVKPRKVMGAIWEGYRTARLV